MSATEELRRLLDERRIEWWSKPRLVVGGVEKGTEFDAADGRWACAIEALDGTICVSHLTPEQAVTVTQGCEITGETSDGFHTFNDLYHHRAVLFLVIVRDHQELAWKSMRHHDGTMYEGMFIVGIETPKGQATYHYDIDPYWDMFDCKELERAPEWDGHSPADAIERIATLERGTCKPILNSEYKHAPYVNDWIVCSACGTRLAERFGIVWQRYCPYCGARITEVTE